MLNPLTKLHLISLFICLLLGTDGWAAPKTLTIVNDVADPVSLDPHREFDASSENIINHIYDGLVRMDSQGRIQPALAESWKRLDDRTVEFQLRKNVFFHNGEPFTASSVRFSLKRQLDPVRPAPNAGLIGVIEDVIVVGAHTVRIKTKEPDGVLLNKLPLFVRILPEAYLKEKGDEGFAQHPIGTGPFVFKRWLKGDRIELEANSKYWIKGIPRVEKVTFRFLPLEKQLEALLSGQVDMVTDLSGLDTLRVVKNPGTKIVKAKNFYTVSLLVNTRKAPFSDVRVRRALAHALDKKALIRYGAKGNAVSLETLGMPGEFGHNPKVQGYPYDPEKAKQLLEEAGYSKGAKIKIQVREEVKNFGKIMAAQLSKAGFKAEPYYVSQEKQFEEVAKPNLDPALPAWDGDMMVFHYVDPTAHVYFPYFILIYSKGPYSLVRNPEFDRLFERMVSTIDLVEQERLAFQIEELVLREAWALSLVQIIRPYGLQKWVHYEPHITGMLDLREVRLDEGL